MKTKKQSKSSKKAIIILVAVLVGMGLFAHFYNQSINNELNDFGLKTVGKIYKISHGAKNSSLKFKYRYKNKTYFSGKPADKLDNPEKSVGKYFVVILSEKNPETARIFLDKEVLDEEKIRDSGF